MTQKMPEIFIRKSNLGTNMNLLVSILTSWAKKRQIVFPYSRFHRTTRSSHFRGRKRNESTLSILHFDKIKIIFLFLFLLKNHLSSRYFDFFLNHRYLTICTSNCKYEVVRRVAARYGMREVTEDSNWNLYWTDLSISIERAKDMKRYQKVNHFPGMTEICRKDLLARNLNRMLRIFPKEYNFFPKTWCFPAE